MIQGAGLIQQFVWSAASAVGGALVVLVAFRTRLALIDRDIATNKHTAEVQVRAVREDSQRTMTNLENRLIDRLDAIDRRQSFLLQMVADIAHKSGADQRFSDAVVRFLAEEYKE